MADVYAVLDRICLSFRDTTSDAMNRHREYKVAGKSFAQFWVNHHGDGRLALILNADPATQQNYVGSAPNVFFVPQYIGHKGWYGIDLASRIRWERIGELVTEAYRRVAPASLANEAVVPTKIDPPDSVDVRDVDPFFNDENQAMLARVRDICLAFPESSEGQSFGSPAFKAGKKTFCEFACPDGKPAALFRVGQERQATLTADKRFDLPPYMGPKGWIRLRLDNRFNEDEVRALAEESYRHFALKRMLKALYEG